MAVPSPSPSKIELRAAALRRRRAYASALAPATRAALEADLARIVLPRLAGARIVAGYHPMRDEISPRAILDALGPGRTAALPWFGGRDSRMLFRAAPAEGPGPWGVLQPPASSPALRPDAVLVPLVLADRSGARIGHGQGHYDRALANLRAAGPVLAVGLAWESQIGEEPLPSDEWDSPLDAIATPREWIDCSSRSPAGATPPESPSSSS